LQISSKQFLNALVKRFPERPPVQTNRVVERILELVHLWTETICVYSKQKNDFKMILEMSRLLTMKGYLFPELNEEDVRSLSPIKEVFKTKDEMEKEDQDVLGVKLQELLRRGTPKDLEEANVIMKKLSGYNVEDRVDYEKKFTEKLNEIENSATVLQSLLSAVQPGIDISSEKSIQVI
jgi:hypothetical protein